MLLLTFEGLPSTVIDSQVLLHARDYAALGVAEFEICAVACFSDLYRRSLDRRADAAELAAAPVRVLRGLRPGIPLSGLVNAVLLLLALRGERGRFTHVHGRTDYGAMVAGLVARLIGARAVWDCRGDVEAEVVERPVSDSALARIVRVALPLRRLAVRVTTGLAGRLCRSAIFVSEPLREARAAALGAKPSEVVPCVASERVFHFDRALRAETRTALGFEDHHRVYVFSGSMTHYQCFGRTVRVFERILRREPDARLLVVTPHQDAARGELARLASDRYILRTAAIDEMNALLNAADCAFMLRDPTRTNAAASPTKFAEYCLAGLPVIMTDAVIDSARLARRLGVFVACAGDDAEAVPEIDREAVMRQALTLLTKRAHVAAYRRIYGGG